MYIVVVFVFSFECGRMTCFIYTCYSLCISAWASALLVLAISGSAKASERGTSDKKNPRLFRNVCASYISLYNLSALSYYAI